MTTLDVLLVLACVVFGASGYRQGFVVGVLSFAGFVGGGVAGMLVVPHLVDDWDPGLRQALVAVGLVVLFATVAQVAATVVAVALRERLTWRPARAVDQLAGALVSVSAVLLISWFLGAAVRQAPVPRLSAQVSGSKILVEVDRVVPDGARTLFGSFRGVLGGSGFPTVFSGLASERIAPVDAPDGSVARRPEVAGAAASVVRIDGDAVSCDRSVEGSGFVVARERVLTNAHVVAGVTRPSVRIGGEGRSYPATVVVYDPRRDVAVLAVPDLPAAPLLFDPTAQRGDDAVVAGFPRGGPYQVGNARVRESFTARGDDIYDREEVQREVFSLYADVAPGNSGGPLLSPAGRVFGVIFATSLDDENTGYALTADEVAPVVAAGRVATDRVDTGGCTD